MFKMRSTTPFCWSVDASALTFNTFFEEKITHGNKFQSIVNMDGFNRCLELILCKCNE